MVFYFFENWRSLEMIYKKFQPETWQYEHPFLSHGR